MLIVKVKPGEKIENAIKKWKNKVRDSKQNNELKDRKEFKKKSVKKREVISRAKYKQSKKNS